MRPDGRRAGCGLCLQGSGVKSPKVRGGKLFPPRFELFKRFQRSPCLSNFTRLGRQYKAVADRGAATFARLELNASVFNLRCWNESTLHFGSKVYPLHRLRIKPAGKAVISLR